MNDNFDISRRRALAALGTIGAASAGAGLGTSAFFSDQETFENNELVAGELDLKVSWDEHYSDWKGDEVEYARMPEPGETPDISLPATDPNGKPIELVFENRAGFMDATRQERFPEGGLGPDEDPCEALADVGDDDVEAPVINISDVKPGDFGEVTFDFAACDNPALLWMNGGLVSESENGVTEPEADDPDEGGTAGNDAPTAPDDDNGDGDGDGGPFSVTPLSESGTPAELAESLIGEESGIEIVEGSVSFDGADGAGGSFSGGGDIYGTDDGVILSSGSVSEVVGPNDSGSETTGYGTDGDDDLDALVDGATQDAAVLEFDFTVSDDAEEVFFNYVFGSEEYNEWVGSQFNDVFGLFVNGENASLHPDTGEPLNAAVNEINNDSNSDLYIDNTDGHLDTEMDGLTVVLPAQAGVQDGTNTLKIAIADRGDTSLDSWVLVEGGSLTTQPPGGEPTGEVELADKLRARAWYDDGVAGDNILQPTEEVFIEGSLRDVLDALASGNGVPLDGNTPAEDGGGTGRNCYSASPDVHYVAFQWWLPVDHGNEVQSDSVTFDLGFYTEQCRHNDGSGMNNEGVDPDEVDP